MNKISYSQQLSILLKEIEHLTLDFKKRYTSKINEDIVAFSNTKGSYCVIYNEKK